MRRVRLGGRFEFSGFAGHMDRWSEKRVCLTTCTLAMLIKEPQAITMASLTDCGTESHASHMAITDCCQNSRQRLQVPC